MKKTIALFLFILCISTIVDAQEIPEPDFSNTPVWLDKNTNSIKGFERPQLNKGSRATGLYSAESYVSIPGTTSTVRFEKSNVPKILLKVSDASVDPFTAVEFASLNVNKKQEQREYILKKAGLGSSNTTQAIIGIDFKKIKDGIYEIQFLTPLEKGEYTFSNSANKAFCFTVYEGIDNKESQGSDLKDSKRKK